MIFTTERYPNINNLTTIIKLVEAMVEQPGEVEVELAHRVISMALLVLLRNTYS